MFNLKPVHYIWLITIIWGSAFPIARFAIQYIDPIFLITINFTISSIIFLFLNRKNLYFFDKKIFKQSLLFGFFNAGAYVFPVVALKTTTAATAAFIVSSNVAFVPIFSYIFGSSRPTISEIIAAIFCILGVYILTGIHMHHLNVDSGIWLALLGVVFISLELIYIQKITQDQTNHKQMALYQLLSTAIFLWLSLFVSIIAGFQKLSSISLNGVGDLKILLGVVYGALLATCLCMFMQIKYQKHMSPTKAALIYSTEPIFAVLVGYFLNGDAITKNMIIGGCIILISSIVSARNSGI